MHRSKHPVTTSKEMAHRKGGQHLLPPFGGNTEYSICSSLQGIRFDPASSQTLRLEFARTNSRVSPRQPPVTTSSQGAVTSTQQLPIQKSGSDPSCKKCNTKKETLGMNGEESSTCTSTCSCIEPVAQLTCPLLSLTSLSLSLSLPSPLPHLFLLSHTRWFLHSSYTQPHTTALTTSLWTYRHVVSENASVS